MPLILELYFKASNSLANLKSVKEIVSDIPMKEENYMTIIIS